MKTFRTNANKTIRAEVQTEHRNEMWDRVNKQKNKKTNEEME